MIGHPPNVTDDLPGVIGHHWIEIDALPRVIRQPANAVNDLRTVIGRNRGYGFPSRC